MIFKIRPKVHFDFFGEFGFTGLFAIGFCSCGSLGLAELPKIGSSKAKLISL